MDGWKDGQADLIRSYICFQNTRCIKLGKLMFIVIRLTKLQRVSLAVLDVRTYSRTPACRTLQV